MLPFPRRLVTLGSAIVLGALATVVLASPASAHDTKVHGKAVCDPQTGEWVVTWSVFNSQDNIVGTLTNVTLSPQGSSVTSITTGATLPLKKDGPLTGAQRLPNETEKASLAVSVLWDYPEGKDDVRDSDESAVDFEDTCNVPNAKPAAAFQSSCQGDVDVTLRNDQGADRAAHFTVTGQAGFSQESTVDAGQAAKVNVPKADAGAITVLEGSAKVAEGKWTQEAACLPVTGVRTGMIATGGLALAGLGAVAFVLFRRRRIHFTS